MNEQVATEQKLRSSGPTLDHEMTMILPRFPQYFKTWDDYEPVAIMIWIVKDFCWIFCTKFTHRSRSW